MTTGNTRLVLLAAALVLAGCTTQRLGQKAPVVDRSTSRTQHRCGGNGSVRRATRGAGSAECIRRDKVERVRTGEAHQNCHLGERQGDDWQHE